MSRSSFLSTALRDEHVGTAALPGCHMCQPYSTPQEARVHADHPAMQPSGQTKQPPSPHNSMPFGPSSLLFIKTVHIKGGVWAKISVAYSSLNIVYYIVFCLFVVLNFLSANRLLNLFICLGCL
ncbi:hypothetical protein AMECASPLE_016248 [Ameca splendens]|uniref:Uncharacterized protein n=1 Tax=Ameca splendens TaxID=208324 RepID=A0ABV0ZBN9_9TELE